MAVLDCSVEREMNAGRFLVKMHVGIHKKSRLGIPQLGHKYCTSLKAVDMSVAHLFLLL